MTELSTGKTPRFMTVGWLVMRGLITTDMVAELVPYISAAIVDDGNPAGHLR